MLIVILYNIAYITNDLLYKQYLHHLWPFIFIFLCTSYISMYKLLVKGEGDQSFWIFVQSQIALFCNKNMFKSNHMIKFLSLKEQILILGKDQYF